MLDACLSMGQGCLWSDHDLNSGIIAVSLNDCCDTVRRNIVTVGEHVQGYPVIQLCDLHGSQMGCPVTGEKYHAMCKWHGGNFGGFGESARLGTTLHGCAVMSDTYYQRHGLSHSTPTFACERHIEIA